MRKTVTIILFILACCGCAVPVREIPDKYRQTSAQESGAVPCDVVVNDCGVVQKHSYYWFKDRRK